MKLVKYYLSKFIVLQKQFDDLNKLNPSNEEYHELYKKLRKAQDKLELLGMRDVFIRG